MHSNPPLVGHEALRFVTREHKQHGSTTYFLSFVNKAPRPKEVFKSYRVFHSRCVQRLRLLTEYSEFLTEVEKERRKIAQEIVEKRSVRGINHFDRLFHCPVQQIIPRSKKYMEIKSSHSRKIGDNTGDIRRLLAALVIQPQIRKSKKGKIHTSK